MPRLLTACALAAAVSTSVIGQSHPMRPGQWEVTASMQMAAMTMPPMTNTQCITAEDLKKASEGGMPAGFSAGPQGTCTVADYKVTDTEVSWKMQCAGANASTGEGRMLFKGDTFDGTLTLTMAQGTMAVKATGKRLGDCSK